MPVQDKSPRVVFIGTNDALFILRAFPRIFEHYGWSTTTCETIEEADQISADVVIVWSSAAALHVKSYEGWKNPPPTIWFCFSPWDRRPDGVQSVMAVTRPSELVQIARDLLEASRHS